METYLSAFTRAAQEGKDYKGMSAWLVQIIVDDILLERKQLEAKIRADERQKAADKFREVFCQKCEQYGLHDRVNDPCPELARLRAAIMAEPEEGV